MTRPLAFPLVLALSGCGQAFTFAVGATDAAPVDGTVEGDAGLDASETGPPSDAAPTWCPSLVPIEPDAGTTRIDCTPGGRLVLTLNNGGTINYGNTYPWTPVGTVSSTTFVFVQNPTGQDTLSTSVRSITLSSDFGVFRLNSDRCSTGGIGTGGCHLGVSFEPPVAGTYRGKVQVELATLGTSTFCFQGDGYDRLVATPRPVCFQGPQPVGTDSPPVNLTLRNVEPFASAPIQLTLVGEDAFRFDSPSQGGCLNASIPAGRSCQLQLFFRPKRLGPLTGVLRVSSEGFAPAVAIPLAGLGQ